MPQSADSIVVGANGAAHVAPVGSTLPESVSDALDAAFTDVGYVSEDGATFRDQKTKEPIPVWQSLYPVKFFVTGASAEVQLALRQWDANTIPLAFGGGVIEEHDPTNFPGEFRYTPPDPEDIDERAFVLEWKFDEADFRLVVPKVMVTSQTETQLTRSAPSNLPLTLGVIGTDGAAPWLLFSNHPEWDPNA